MKTYKVEATEKVRSVGWFEAETEEEAIEMFRLESLKVDHNVGRVGYLSSGWMPIATEVTDAEV